MSRSYGKREQMAAWLSEHPDALVICATQSQVDEWTAKGFKAVLSSEMSAPPTIEPFFKCEDEF